MPASAISFASKSNDLIFSSFAFDNSAMKRHAGFVHLEFINACRKLINFHLQIPKYGCSVLRQLLNVTAENTLCPPIFD